MRTRSAPFFSFFSFGSFIVAAALQSPANGQNFSPDDFVAEDLNGTFNQPTCIRFANNSDLLVAEKAGLVWDVRSGTKRATPVIDLHLEILNNGDRGLMSLAVDPNFATNGWLYLLYVVDPNGDGQDVEQETFGRLTRFTTSVDVNGNLIADPGSRLVLIGATWPEGIPSLHLSHAPGDIRFASDGSLFVSTGDGAHFDLTDPGGFDPNGFGAGKFDASEDIGAFRAQSFTSLSGKILRIDPATGMGLPDNPFFTGNAADHQSMIWAMGLRNPFRFCLIPGTGPVEQLYICNVGWSTWEAVFNCKGGENFGWPCFEGPYVQSDYANIDMFGDCDDPSLFTPPFFTYKHDQYDPKFNSDFSGTCTAGACVYNGTEYPSLYQGRLFVADYSLEWIRTILVINGSAAQSDSFASSVGHPVDLTPDPVNGDILYSALSANVIRRIRYTKADHAPVALATVTPAFGLSPLTVSFDASASYDPEGGALTYDWDLGDGNHSSQAVLTYTYTNPKVYSAVLTVTDPTGRTGSLTRQVSVDNFPPDIVSIDSPAANSFYRVGDTLSFDATITDVEDDPAGLPLDVQWIVTLVHDHHTHPDWATLNGAHTTYVAPVHDSGVYLHVTLVATDSGGLQSSSEFDLFDSDAKPEPHLSAITDTAPRVGRSITATGHVHYAGKGDADLVFDWGDGSVDRFRASHLVDCSPSHVYIAPGVYPLRFTTSDATDSETELQSINVRPLFPQVAIFAPLVAAHWIPVADQWSLASTLVNDLATAGFDAKVFGAADQPALAAWMAGHFHDVPRDWLLCLDDSPSVAYAGQNQGSLAERWLNDGNGIVWTGFNPFAYYVDANGVEGQAGAGPFALDELLNAATPQLVSGAGHMDLKPDGADLPQLVPFDSSCALATAKLGPAWSVVKLYAADAANPPESDALVVRNAKGGEYAQFYCVDDATLPREAVLRDFFLSHVYRDLPGGPTPFELVSPANKAKVADREPTLVWKAGGRTTSWLVEIATDNAFTKPVFTATVVRDTKLQDPTASVKVTPPLRGNTRYRWRVTARNDFGTVVSETRGFRIR